MYTNVYIHTYVCMYAWMYVCMYVCMHVCMYVCMHACMHACMHVCMHVCMYVCMYVCTYVCMYVYVCIYIYMVTPPPPTLMNPRLSPKSQLQDGVGCWDSVDRNCLTYLQKQISPGTKIEGIQTTDSGRIQLNTPRIHPRFKIQGAREKFAV